MMRAPARAALLRCYTTSVAVAGVALLVLLAAGGGVRTLRHGPAAVWLFAAMVVIAELFPVPLSDRGQAEAVTMSNAFAFPLLLGWDAGAAALPLAAGCAIADLVRRRPLSRVLFNVGQYSLSLGAAAGVYAVAGGRHPPTLAQLPAFVGAALAFLLLNDALVGVVAAPDRPAGPVGRLRSSVGFELWTSAMLFGLAPIALVVAEHALALVPLLLLPVAAVYLASKAAVLANARRIQAEQVAAAATELAEQERQLAEAARLVVRQLQESERVKDELLAVVSHELRTPLTGILGSLATLRHHGRNLAPDQQEDLLVMAAGEGARLKSLIEQLLLASRFNSGSADEPPPARIDAAELVCRAGRAAAFGHPRRHIDVQVSGALPVRAVPEVLLQVVANLLDNAVKYSAGGPIRLRAAAQQHLVVVAVEDDGPGVPADERERVFERFTQLDQSATRPAGGVGLGLYIARQLARSQRGDVVAAEPTGGCGARFEFRLPLAEGHDQVQDRAGVTATVGRDTSPRHAGQPAATTMALTRLAAGR